MGSDALRRHRIKLMSVVIAELSSVLSVGTECELMYYVGLRRRAARQAYGLVVDRPTITLCTVHSALQSTITNYNDNQL